MVNKLSNYQKARNSCINVEGLHDIMLAIQRHNASHLVRREQLFSVFYEQARREGLDVDPSRMQAAHQMLAALDTLAACLPKP